MRLGSSLRYQHCAADKILEAPGTVRDAGTIQLGRSGPVPNLWDRPKRLFGLLPREDQCRARGPHGALVAQRAGDSRREAGPVRLFVCHRPTVTLLPLFQDPCGARESKGRIEYLLTVRLPLG